MNDLMAKTEGYVEQGGTFGSCPFEIRNEIYRLCLITHVEIVPYPQPHERDKSYLSVKPQFPSPALLAINRMFGNEARAVLYSENVWRLPTIRPDTDDPTPTIYHRHPNLFHSVTVVFDQRDVSEESKLAASKKVHAKCNTSSNGFIRSKAEIHGEYSYLAWMVWSAKLELLRSLPHLSLITVQLENFACPGGCCRYIALREAGSFYKYVLKGLTPKGLPLLFRGSNNGQGNPRVVVKGLLNAAERDLIHGEFGFGVAEEE